MPRATPPPHRSTARAVRPVAVFLVDDHHVVREALSGSLDRERDLDVVGSAASVQEIGHAKVDRRPDVAVVDYRLPDGNGVDACLRVRARWPRVRIVMLTATADEAGMLGTVRAGASGYVTKGQRLAVLVDAIRAAARDQPSLAPEVIGRIARELQTAPAQPELAAPLTSRELVVLRALVEGRSTTDIAAALGVTPGTVRRHVEAIRHKLGAHSRLEAVSTALRRHIVPLSAA